MEIQSVDDFIDSLLKDKGITNVEPDVLETLKAEMKERLMTQMNQAAIMQLSEEKAAELSQLMDDPNFTAEQMGEFMRNSGVNLTEVALDTMLKFRSFYLGAEA